MSNHVQNEEVVDLAPSAAVRVTPRHRIAAGALSIAVAVVGVCAFAATAHAANTPFSLTFVKASNDLPIVMPICCQSRTR
ncbi:hypothetical protein [Burkholderia orbicola]|uniref:Uncharacterized protein n=1 Tax=Burkholderia orbicola TaxID=2978683 RepID=A0ABT8NXR5_9BURK|nr:hypothetical protein [Burkholderia orbicola]MDN7526363.1 hypothetical protein [Burkholderia orbicola]